MLELIALVSLVASWLIPNHYPPWSSFYNESAAAIALLLLVLTLRRTLVAQRAPLVSWVLIACATVPALQAAAMQPPFVGDALVSALYLLGAGIAVAAGSAWCAGGSGRATGLIAGAVAAGGTVSAILALIQAFEIQSLGIWLLDNHIGQRAFANLAQPNNLATLLGLGILGVLVLREQRRFGVVVACALASLLLVGAALTQSRTALAFGPVFLTGWWLADRRNLALKTPMWTLAAGTAIHWMLTLAWPSIQEALLLSPPPSLLERGVGSVRFEMWPILLDAISQRPWLGYGWLQVGAAELTAVDRYPPVGELWLQGHNLFLELVIWCGVPLGALLCGAILYWWVSRWWRVRTLQALSGMLAVSIFGAHAMLELPHHYAYFLVPIGLWVGIVESEVSLWRPVPARWVIAPALIGVLLLSAIWKDYPAVEEDFRVVRFEGLRIGGLRAGQPSPDAPFLSSLTEFLRFARTEPRHGMTAAELDRMEAVVKRYPYAQSLYRYGVALALNGRLPEAKQQFVRMRHIHGELLYGRLKAQLAENAGGQELLALLNSLPE